MAEREETINWRNLIAACAAVCVFAFSLGEIFPLLSLNMEADGVTPRMIGFNTAMAPIGILVAGLFIPRLSHRFGAKRVALFMAFATGGIFLLYPTFHWLPAWFVLRFIQGMTVATLFALSEAWVLSNATGRWRGLIVGAYATCISATFGVGAGVIGWVGIAGYMPFVVGAVVLCLTALPISMLSAKASEADYDHVPMLHFLPKAPMLLGAIFVHAIFDGGMLGFLSVYGVRGGMTVEAAALLLTALSFGNVFFQIPIGWIADQIGKTPMMMVCFVLSIVGLAVLPFSLNSAWIWPLMLFLGAAGFGIYTIGLAQLGDRFKGADLIAGTSAFSTAWGLGALAGSVACGLAMNHFGPDGFPHALLAIFVAYLVVRIVTQVMRRAAR
ncbi:MFS transporter [Dongia sedimenti]|uniref:MFS transporter n=1 Tax=Dongia sedimenti TaxID=3064282 RepID=A0ABU0YFH5_9PROT|nr:MFS transporter [Rhodospirillaceae bacterium R-7]